MVFISYSAKKTRFLDLCYITATAIANVKFHMYDTAYDKAQTMFMELIKFASLLSYNIKENR